MSLNHALPDLIKLIVVAYYYYIYSYVPVKTHFIIALNYTYQEFQTKSCVNWNDNIFLNKDNLIRW